MRQLFVIMLIVFAFSAPAIADPITPPDNQDQLNEAPIYAKVDISPSYPGGTPVMAQDIHDNIRYPARDSSMGTEGTVYVRFVVEPDGTTSNYEIYRGVSITLDREALRIMSALKPFSPGFKNGQAVRTRLILPIRFELQTWPSE